MKASTKLISGMRLSGKLITAILFVAGLAVISSTLSLTWVVDSEMKQQVFDKIDAVGANKRSQIEDYFSLIQHQVTTLSQDRMIVNAVQEFSKAYKVFEDESGTSSEQLQRYRSEIARYYQDQFGAELERQSKTLASTASLLPDSVAAVIAQNRYIAANKYPMGRKDALVDAGDGSSYSKVHALYHPVINDYQKKFGYYDIFLIEPNDGNIVYSVFKEIDFATSLLNGPYSTTNFARAFKSALNSAESDATVLVDFEPYLPSYNSPASFIASPIFDAETLVGVLVFQMPIDNINRIMAQNAGLGTSGESYLVGQDLKMRSQSRASDDNTILSLVVDTEAVRMANFGKTGVITQQNRSGQQVMAAYTPLEIDGLRWNLITEIAESEALAITDQLHLILLAILAVTLLLSTVTALLVARSITKPISHAVKVAENISQGDLDNQIEADGHDEIKQLLRSLAIMQTNLRDRIESDRRAAAENTRVRQALDSVSANVMVVDPECNIIYMNDAVCSLMQRAQADIRKDMPTFNAGALLGNSINVFFDGASRSCRAAVDLASAKSTSLSIGGCTFRIVVTPIVANSRHIGTAIEWQDRSQQAAIEEEIEGIVNGALSGDLQGRIDLSNKDGFFESLSQGVNELMNINEHVINDTVAMMSAMSRGDLTQSIDADYAGSFGQLKVDANSTIERLTNVIAEINNGANAVLNGSREIAQGNNNLSQRTEEQATSLEETASSMEQMTTTVRQNADNAQRANQLAAGAREQAERGGQVVSDAVSAMGEITASSKKIADIIGVIDEIAFQTNLLALNAAVEAARAGEQGRGFAVVASEVRNLAGRSATAAKEIKELIEDSVHKVGEGSKLVDESGATLDEIKASVRKVSDLIAEIAAASEEQSTGIEQVNNAIAQMDEMTQQNAALVEQAAAASEVMGEQARGLNDLVSFFNTHADDGQAPALERRGSDRPWTTQSASGESGQPPATRKLANSDYDDGEWEEF